MIIALHCILDDPRSISPIMYTMTMIRYRGTPETKLRFLAFYSGHQSHYNNYHALIPLFTSIDQVLRDRNEGSIVLEREELALIDSLLEAER